MHKNRRRLRRRLQMRWRKIVLLVRHRLWAVAKRNILRYRQRAGSGGSAVSAEVCPSLGQRGDRGQDCGFGQHGEATNRAPSDNSGDREPSRRQGLDLWKSHDEMPKASQRQGLARPSRLSTRAREDLRFFAKSCSATITLRFGVMTSHRRN